jgi:hypothetical protein
MSATLARTGLPAGKTRADALALAVAYRKLLWSPDNCTGPEDQRIDALNAYCTRLYRGDKKAGRDLAIDAIWEGA